jgi:hypothetical protein
MSQENQFGYKVEKGTLSLASEKSVDPNKLYLIDFSKLNSVNDLVLILAAMSIAFPGDHPHIGALKPFLNMENPMDIPNRLPEQPKQQEFKLPKLKGVK